MQKTNPAMQFFKNCNAVFQTDAAENVGDLQRNNTCDGLFGCTVETLMQANSTVKPKNTAMQDPALKVAVNCGIILTGLIIPGSRVTDYICILYIRFREQH